MAIVKIKFGKQIHKVQYMNICRSISQIDMVDYMDTCVNLDVLSPISKFFLGNLANRRIKI